MPITRQQFDEMRRAGLTEQQIIDRVKRMDGGAAVPGPEPRLGPTVARRLISGIPPALSVGGAVLGSYGGPVGTVAGAGAGAAGGKVIENYLLKLMGEQLEPSMTTRALEAVGVPLPQSGTARELLDVAGEGVAGAAAEGTGLGLAGGFKQTGRHLMRKAITNRPLIAQGRTTPAKIAEQADLAIAERVAPGGKFGRHTGEMGSEVLRGRIRESGRELDVLLQRAKKAGVRIDPGDLTNEIGRLYEDIYQQPLRSGDLRSLDKMLGRFFRDHPGPMTPKEVKLLKRSAQQLAEHVITGPKGRTMRPWVDPKFGLEAKFNDAIATSAKRALERIPKYGKAIGKREARTSSLIGLRDVMRKAESAGTNVKLELGGPVRTLGASSPGVVLTRPQAGQTALWLTGRGTQGIVRQLPRTIGELLEQLSMQGGEK